MLSMIDYVLEINWQQIFYPETKWLQSYSFSREVGAVGLAGVQITSGTFSVVGQVTQIVSKTNSIADQKNRTQLGN